MKLIGIIIGFIVMMCAVGMHVTVDTFYIMLAIMVAGLMTGD